MQNHNALTANQQYTKKPSISI